MTDNQHVDAGQLLIRLDGRDFQAALDHAQAIADQRQASLAGLEAKYVMQQAMIKKAEADLNAEVARVTFTGADAIRYRELASTTFGTRKNPSGHRQSIRRRSRPSNPLNRGLLPRGSN